MLALGNFQPILPNNIACIPEQTENILTTDVCAESFQEKNAGVVPVSLNKSQGYKVTDMYEKKSLLQEDELASKEIWRAPLVWKYFTHICGGALCKVCCMKIRVHSGETLQLEHHLNSKHKRTYSRFKKECCQGIGGVTPTMKAPLRTYSRQKDSTKKPVTLTKKDQEFFAVKGDWIPTDSQDNHTDNAEVILPDPSPGQELISNRIKTEPCDPYEANNYLPVIGYVVPHLNDFTLNNIVDPESAITKSGSDGTTSIAMPEPISLTPHFPVWVKKEPHDETLTSTNSCASTSLELPTMEQFIHQEVIKTELVEEEEESILS